MEDFPKSPANNLEGGNEDERLGQWLMGNPLESFEVHEKNGQFVESAIEQFEIKMAEFESRHSLEALYAVDELTVEDAPHHPIREPARLDLNLPSFYRPYIILKGL
jgi:hypothetical protein